MALWNLGSASNEIYNLVPNIPASISGNSILALIDRERLRMEDYTGATIGSVSIAEKYQPALVDLSIAKLLPLIHLQAGGTVIDGVSMGNSAMDSAKYFEDRGMSELRRLGMRTTVYKAYG